MNPRPNIRVLRETDDALLLDGDGSMVVAAARAMRWCVERARARKGMALAAVRRSQPIVPGYFARLAAEAGQIGFACTNAIPMVAPPGSTQPTLGTNPFGYALPAGRYPPVVFDVATTTTAAFTVRLAARRGEAVPLGMVLDRDGRPSTDPADFDRGGSIAPLGSPAAPHKGFGLALFVDALAGVLSGGGFARGLADDQAGVGNTFWALDVEAFMPRAEFLARMDEQIEQVKAAERMAGVDELFVPGERGHRRYLELTTGGTVPISAASWAVLAHVCAPLSVSLPPVSSAEP